MDIDKFMKKLRENRKEVQSRKFKFYVEENNNATENCKGCYYFDRTDSSFKGVCIYCNQYKRTNLYIKEESND